MQRSEARRGGAAGAGPLGFDVMSYNPSQWARAGRVAKELFQEAGEHLQVWRGVRESAVLLGAVWVARGV